mmetsp:Transcript_52903/g.85651  ORF Transcript_52903/g.85651 Transcript_52903/m.85651 type:complete len:263 (+) Transcript_52903:357-1145(+)
MLTRAWDRSPSSHSCQQTCHLSVRLPECAATVPRAASSSLLLLPLRRRMHSISFKVPVRQAPLPPPLWMLRPPRCRTPRARASRLSRSVHARVRGLGVKRASTSTSSCTGAGRNRATRFTTMCWPSANGLRARWKVPSNSRRTAVTFARSSRRTRLRRPLGSTIFVRPPLPWMRRRRRCGMRSRPSAPRPQCCWRSRRRCRRWCASRRSPTTASQRRPKNFTSCWLKTAPLLEHATMVYLAIRRIPHTSFGPCAECGSSRIP